MAYQALANYRNPKISAHFVSNVDPVDIGDCLEVVNLEETLFIVASKSFTTTETLANANVARARLVAELGNDAVGHHFVALSTNHEAVEAFGISPDRTFGFWDWVGGRYSLGSAIGLSLMICIGPDNFGALLKGMENVDNHFLTQPLAKNVPVVMGLLSIWNTNFLEHPTQAVIPYSNRLARFPAYLQQLEMESNGKSVNLDGQELAEQSCPVVWGEPGTNGQHAFFQLLHQGTQIVPCDFIGHCKPQGDDTELHDNLMSNMFAQARSLAYGRTHDNPHRRFAGDRPTTTLLLDELSPFSLGQLIALYEHKTFTAGTILGVNSFDQFGVELGKEQAKQILPAFASDSAPNYDS